MRGTIAFSCDILLLSSLGCFYAGDLRERKDKEGGVIFDGATTSRLELLKPYICMWFFRPIRGQTETIS